MSEDERAEVQSETGWATRDATGTHLHL